MAPILGGELEIKEVEIRDSTLEARKIFLQLIGEYKKDVALDLLRLFNVQALPLEIQNSKESLKSITKEFLFYLKNEAFYFPSLYEHHNNSDVRETPVLAYFEYLFENHEKLKNLPKSKRKNRAIHSNYFDKESFANFSIANIIPNITDIIPNWKALQSRSNSKRLRSLLIDWAEKWNLNEEWCLDFALSVLKNFKTELIDDLSLTEDLFDADATFDFFRYEEYFKGDEKFLKGGMAWETALLDLKFDNAIAKQAHSVQLPKYLNFKFGYLQEIKKKQKIIFEIKDHWHPTLLSKAEFKKKLEKEFWRQFLAYYRNKVDLLVGNFSEISKKFNEFDNSLDEYMWDVESKYKQIAVRPVTKKSADEHFHWLIDYQIPPVQNYSELARKKGLDRTTIKGGVKSVAGLIGLTLRKSQYTGRKKQ